MKTVAAVDSGGSAHDVLETARRLATLLVTDVEAVHVHEDGRRSPLAEAAAAGVRLHTSSGEPASGILEALNHDDVLMAVLGKGGDEQRGSAVGSVARGVMTHASKPIVLVPRNPKVFQATGVPEKVIVTFDGAPTAAKAWRDLLDRPTEHDVDIVERHVMNSVNAPQYWDRFYYDYPAWYERLRQRSRSVVSDVLRLADAEKASLIAVAWSEVFDPGRARCLTELLRSTRLPVVVVPARVAATPDAPLVLAGAA